MQRPVGLGCGLLQRVVRLFVPLVDAHLVFEHFFDGRPLRRQPRVHGRHKHRKVPVHVEQQRRQLAVHVRERVAGPPQRAQLPPKRRQHAQPPLELPGARPHHEKVHQFAHAGDVRLDVARQLVRRHQRGVQAGPPRLRLAPVLPDAHLQQLLPRPQLQFAPTGDKVRQRLHEVPQVHGGAGGGLPVVALGQQQLHASQHAGDRAVQRQIQHALPHPQNQQQHGVVGPRVQQLLHAQQQRRDGAVHPPNFGDVGGALHRVPLHFHAGGAGGAVGFDVHRCGRLANCQPRGTRRGQRHADAAGAGGVARQEPVQAPSRVPLHAHGRCSRRMGVAQRRQPHAVAVAVSKRHGGGACRVCVGNRNLHDVTHRGSGRRRGRCGCGVQRVSVDARGVGKRRQMARVHGVHVLRGQLQRGSPRPRPVTVVAVFTAVTVAATVVVVVVTTNIKVVLELVCVVKDVLERVGVCPEQRRWRGHRLHPRPEHACVHRASSVAPGSGTGGGVSLRPWFRGFRRRPRVVQHDKQPTGGAGSRRIVPTAGRVQPQPHVAYSHPEQPLAQLLRVGVRAADQRLQRRQRRVDRLLKRRPRRRGRERQQRADGVRRAGADNSRHRLQTQSELQLVGRQRKRFPHVFKAGALHRQAGQERPDGRLPRLLFKQRGSRRRGVRAGGLQLRGQRPDARRRQHRGRGVVQHSVHVPERHGHGWAPHHGPGFPPGRRVPHRSGRVAQGAQRRRRVGRRRVQRSRHDPHFVFLGQQLQAVVSDSRFQRRLGRRVHRRHGQQALQPPQRHCRPRSTARRQRRGGVAGWHDRDGCERFQARRDGGGAQPGVCRSNHRVGDDGVHRDVARCRHELRQCRRQRRVLGQFVAERPQRRHKRQHGQQRFVASNGGRHATPPARKLRQQPDAVEVGVRVQQRRSVAVEQQRPQLQHRAEHARRPHQAVIAVCRRTAAAAPAAVGAVAGAVAVQGRQGTVRRWTWRQRRRHRRRRPEGAAPHTGVPRVRDVGAQRVPLVRKHLQQRLWVLRRRDARVRQRVTRPHQVLVRRDVGGRPAGGAQHEIHPLLQAHQRATDLRQGCAGGRRSGHDFPVGGNQVSQHRTFLLGRPRLQHGRQRKPCPRFAQVNGSRQHQQHSAVGAGGCAAFPHGELQRQHRQLDVGRQNNGRGAVCAGGGACSCTSIRAVGVLVARHGVHQVQQPLTAQRNDPVRQCGADLQTVCGWRRAVEGGRPLAPRPRHHAQRPDLGEFVCTRHVQHRVATLQHDSQRRHGVGGHLQEIHAHRAGQRPHRVGGSLGGLRGGQHRVTSTLPQRCFGVCQQPRGVLERRVRRRRPHSGGADGFKGGGKRRHAVGDGGHALHHAGGGPPRRRGPQPS